MNRKTIICYFFSFLLALLLKQYLVYYFNSVYDDQVSQLLGALNINKGAGYTIESVSLQNLSVSVSQRMVGWPPLPSYLLAGMLKLAGNNAYLACYWLDALLALIHVSVISVLMYQIRLPLLVSCLFIVMAGADLNDYIRDSTFSDLMGLDAMLLCFFSLWFYFKKENFMAACVAAFFALTAAYVKYHYVPVAVFLPILLMADAWFRNNRVLLRRHFFLTVSMLFLVSVQFVWNRISGAPSFYIYPTELGFYPENIQYHFPYFCSGWMDIVFVQFQVVSNMGVPHAFFNILVYYINLGCLVFFLIVFFQLLTRQIKGVVFSAEQRFGFAILALSLCITSFLLLLSLTRSYHHPADTQLWTFISEFRYFNTASFGLNLFTLLFLSWEKISSNPFRWKKHLLNFLLLLMIVQIFHVAWFASKKALTGNLFDDSKFEERPDYAFLLDLVNQERASGWDVVLTSDNLNIAAFCNIYGIKTLMTAQQLLKGQPSTDAPVCLILRIPDRNYVIYRSVIRQNKMELVGSSGENNYYKTYVYPNKRP